MKVKEARAKYLAETTDLGREGVATAFGDSIMAEALEKAAKMHKPESTLAVFREANMRWKSFAAIDDKLSQDGFERGLTVLDPSLSLALGFISESEYIIIRANEEEEA